MGRKMNQKKKRIKTKKPIHHILYSRIFLSVVIFLSLIVLLILAFTYVDFNFVKKPFEKPHLIEIRDECSFILGNLVHQIRDETDCNLRCNNFCNMEETKFISSEFVYSNNSCHSCDCYCK